MATKQLNRRDFLNRSMKTAAGLMAASLVPRSLAAANISNPKIPSKVIVLGIDGMDPVLLRRFVQRGEMPTFERFIKSNYFSALRTTIPPQSPVAWSSFISGTNPGGNGIFDFIHREPESFLPYLSTSRSYNAEKNIKIGNWSVPLKGGRVELLRRGPAFWTFLQEHAIPATLFKLPANFPVVPGNAQVLSDMGTPDLLGTYGTFTYFTDVKIPDAEKFTGGRVVNVEPVDHVIRMKLQGPANSFRSDDRMTEAELIAYRDPSSGVAKINIQGQEVVLNQGDWSEWIPVRFELMPLMAGVTGIIKLYLQEAHPNFKLYVSPINIDPMNCALPISSPTQYAEEISQIIGRFYTQGFPEDTKALSNGIFSDEEFLIQSKQVLEERLKAFDYELNQFREGFFFFYFGSIDQNTHMMLRAMDNTHPLYRQDASPEVKDAVTYFYRRMDDVLKQTLSKVDSNTILMIISDHGFAPFSREFHLSTWLVENGFTAVTDANRMHDGEFYQYVDWPRTKAYVMGLNGIYINVRGRERDGSVFMRDMEKVKEEIQSKLADVQDPQTGKKIITQVYDSRKIYSGPFTAVAPDLVVGYQSGYRISDEAVLGKFPRGIVGDRKDKWSADHCMDPAIVPGVLLTNREVSAAQPALWDLAPTILNAFDVPVPQEMDGKPIFKT